MIGILLKAICDALVFGHDAKNFSQDMKSLSNARDNGKLTYSDYKGREYYVKNNHQVTYKTYYAKSDPSVAQYLPGIKDGDRYMFDMKTRKPLLNMSSFYRTDEDTIARDQAIRGGYTVYKSKKYPDVFSLYPERDKVFQGKRFVDVKTGEIYTVRRTYSDSYDFYVNKDGYIVRLEDKTTGILKAMKERNPWKYEEVIKWINKYIETYNRNISRGFEPEYGFKQPLTKAQKNEFQLKRIP